LQTCQVASIDLVFWLVLVGIFLVFTILILKENLVSSFCYIKDLAGAGAPFFPKKGGVGLLLAALSPPF
jgi:hypothetical protein